jgi:AcrR family transcriptional regulator
MPRGARRRPDVAPPPVEKIPPKSRLSRADVIANQRARIFHGLAEALSYHGYEDTKVTDIVELSGVSRATFYERFESKEACFADAYEDGVERLVAAVEAAVDDAAEDWEGAVSAGLAAGLEFLASDPPLAHLLLVEALAAARPARIEHERSLVRLAEALRSPVDLASGELPDETLRLLAGGLASHVSGRVLRGEAERLPEDHDLLLGFLLAPTQAADARVAGG